MSHLESEAKPMLIPLARGERTALSMPDQLMVATWATKTTMALEPTWSKPTFTSDADRRIVMIERRPPAAFRVWAAAYEGAIGPLRTTHLVATIDRRDGDPVGMMLLVTMQLGTLVLQVAVGTESVPSGEGVTASGSVLPDRIQLFPPVLTSSQWPPARILDDAGYVKASQNPGLLVPGVRPLEIVGLHDLPGATRP